MFKMKTSTVALTDFEMRSPTLARVILSLTGKHTKESIHAALAAKFDGLAAPVANSFRMVTDTVAVGFIKANKEVRAVDTQELKAKYRVVSSNVFMSAEDKSLWAKQEGAAGTYLTRQGQEDLSELMAGVKHSRTDVPALRHLSTPVAAKSELLAYVTSEGNMDYGFAVAHKGAQVKVVSFYGRVPRVIDYSSVVSIVPVVLDKQIKASVTAGLSDKEKSDAVSYWKKLYSYDPDYMQEVVRQVEEDATA